MPFAKWEIYNSIGNADPLFTVGRIEIPSILRNGTSITHNFKKKVSKYDLEH